MKKLNQYLQLIPIALVALTVAISSSVHAADKKPTVMLGMSHMSNAFTKELSDAAIAKAKELGVNLVVTDAGQDIAKQISQVESALSQGVDAIVVEAVSVDGIKPAITAANAAKVPFVTVNQKATDQNLASSFVGASHEAGGIMEMEAAAKDLGGKGNVVILMGPMGSDAQIGRDKGYKQVLAKYPDIKVLYEQTANWDTDQALKLMENWLQTGAKIDAVVAQNDGMALGALKAAEDAKLKIKIYGLDATPDALQAVKEGRLTGTVSQSTADQGAEAIATAVKLIKGDKVEKEIIVKNVLINSENIGQYTK